MTPYEKKRELIFSVGATAFSALLLARCFSYPAESSGFPKFLCGLMLLFSVILLHKTMRAPTEEDEIGDAGKRAGFRRNVGTALAVIGGTVAYVLAIMYIGYFVGTTVFFLGAMVVFGKNKFVPSLLASSGFMVVMYALFVWFLGMRLPEGILV